MSDREHELKCWPDFFGPLLDGSKPFEVRFNDRDYRVGDTLHEREWNPAAKAYTGRECRVRVTYVLSGQMGVGPGHAVMGVKRLPEKTEDILTHLTITSEQATEILGKDKEIERLEAKLQSERGDDALATMRLLEESDAQSVLLKKAEALLTRADSVLPWGAPLIDDIRAVLSELQQLKGK